MEPLMITVSAVTPSQYTAENAVMPMICFVNNCLSGILMRFWKMRQQRLFFSSRKTGNSTNAPLLRKFSESSAALELPKKKKLSSDATKTNRMTNNRAMLLSSRLAYLSLRLHRYW